MTRALLLLMLLLLTAPSALAADRASQSDIQQVEEALFQARTAVSLLRTGDFRLRAELAGELERARAESSDLRSRLAAGGPVERGVVVAIRERVDTVRRRARGPESVTGMGLGPTAVAPPVSSELTSLDVPPGTVGVARLLDALNLETLQVGDRREAVVAEDIRVGARVVAPAGSLLRGMAEAGASGPALVFDQILIGFTTFRVRATPRNLAPVDTIRVGHVFNLLFSQPIEPVSATRGGQ
ncbi:MAG: hypothetical protein ABL971_14995 [Vicinamibacterales bacterium]